MNEAGNAPYVKQCSWCSASFSGPPVQGECPRSEDGLHAELSNLISERHQHEEPPLLNPEGRCLVCWRMSVLMGQTPTDLAAAGYHVVQEGQAVTVDGRVMRLEGWGKTRNRSSNERTDTYILRPLTDEAPPCAYCNGARWVDDENWQPEWPGKKREQHDGRIPCGGCNEGGWDTPEGPTT